MRDPVLPPIPPLPSFPRDISVSLSDHGPPDQATLQKFQQFYDKFCSQSGKSLDDEMTWLDELERELKSDAAVDDFFEWVEKQQTNSPTDDPSSIFASVSGANWKTGNDSLLTLNSLLRRSRGGVMKEIHGLGMELEEFELGLQIHGSPLVP